MKTKCLKQFVAILILLVPGMLLSQECNCESDFHWLKKTFEENDAGYSYVLDKKGEQAYEQLNAITLAKVQAIDNKEECDKVLRDWLHFFRSNHIALQRLTAENTNRGDTLNDEAIIAQYKDRERVDLDLRAFEKYLEAKKQADYEGIWISPPYKIAIKKSGDSYTGSIVEADGVYWTPGQVKLKINPDNRAVFYMRDHSPVNIKKTELLGNNYLQLDFINLQRVFPKYKDSPEIVAYYNTLKATKPYFEKVDKKTVLLRIPSFQSSEKKTIDSVIAVNRDKILSTPNLIIDIRNNGGGSDASYYELLPLLYTNPIRTLEVEYRSTPLNNQRMLDFIKDPKYGFDEEAKKWAQKAYDTLSKHLGEFVSLNEYPVSVYRRDTIYPYPKNIGIIIDENNGSTAEQFLLAARQSKKVKLFGTTTAGVLDISNMYGVQSPCRDLELDYCLTRSLRIPDMTIDDKGIQPDYYMDQSIPKYNWIKFVTLILEE